MDNKKRGKTKMENNNKNNLNNIEKQNKAEERRDGFWYSIIGLCKLFAVVSIAYSSIIIINGMDDLNSKIMVVPQIVLAASMLINAFCKKGKK